MHNQVNETQIRRIRSNPRNNLNIRDVKTHTRLRAGPVCIGTVQFEISQNQIPLALIKRDRTVDACPLSGHLPERDWLARCSLDLSVDMPDNVVASAQPKDIPSMARPAGQSRRQVIGLRYCPRTRGGTVGRNIEICGLHSGEGEQNT